MHHQPRLRDDLCGNFNFGWGANTSHWMWETRWNRNPSQCIERSGLLCQDLRTGQEHWFNGGWVHPDGKYSGVNCATGSYTCPRYGNFDWTTYPYPGYFKFERVWTFSNCGLSAGQVRNRERGKITMDWNGGNGGSGLGKGDSPVYGSTVPDIFELAA